MLGTREIGMAAFSGCAEVTAVHVLKGVQSLGEGVFQGMPALQEVYFEGGDASVLGESRFQFDEKTGGVRICLPKDAPKDQIDAIITKMNQNLLPGREMVILKDCPDVHTLP